MHIREFSWPDDYKAVVELWKVTGLYNPSSDSPHHIRQVVERNPGLFLLAVEPERGIVGSVIGAFDGRRGYLYHVAVHPDFQRKGYGSALLREVERRLWALGAPKIRLLVGYNNLSAVAFYRSLGFEVDSATSMSKLPPDE
jgi:ribosomal protein S18 acetylase RimI-like enzyme